MSFDFATKIGHLKKSPKPGPDCIIKNHLENRQFAQAAITVWCLYGCFQN